MTEYNKPATVQPNSAPDLVTNPYIIGAVVPPAQLVGRRAIVAHIEAAWLAGEQRAPLIIVGQRRIGKSSLVHGFQRLCRFADTAVAVVNLQSVDWSQELVDLCYAIAVDISHAASQRQAPSFEEYERQPLTALRQALVAWNEAQAQRHCLLALDEYELLEELPAEAAGNFISLLEEAVQRCPWLMVALVGAHTPEECNDSLHQRLSGWRVLRLGRLEADEFSDLLQAGDNAAFRYSPQALARAYQLTGGQPFLGQVLGSLLVECINEQQEDRGAPPWCFSSEDVEAVLDSQECWLRAGEMYFSGLWQQAAQGAAGQQTILKVLTDAADGLDRQALQTTSELDADTFNAALESLEQQDVVA